MGRNQPHLSIAAFSKLSKLLWGGAGITPKESWRYSIEHMNVIDASKEYVVKSYLCFYTNFFTDVYFTSLHPLEYHNKLMGSKTTWSHTSTSCFHALHPQWGTPAPADRSVLSKQEYPYRKTPRPDYLPGLRSVFSLSQLTSKVTYHTFSNVCYALFQRCCAFLVHFVTYGSYLVIQTHRLPTWWVKKPWANGESYKMTWNVRLERNIKRIISNPPVITDS